MAKDDFQPKILYFMCQWCGYSAADLAGANRMAYPASVRSIEVTCSGMVHPNWVVNSLLAGVDGVMIFGCHKGQCHYGSGNRLALKREDLILQTLDDIGLERERFSMKWVSAAEAGPLVAAIKEMTQKLSHLPPNRNLGLRLSPPSGPGTSLVGPKFVRTINDKRYYWDGNIYQAHSSAQKAISDYLDKGFEAKLVPTSDGILIYTRRDSKKDEGT